MIENETKRKSWFFIVMCLLVFYFSESDWHLTTGGYRDGSNLDSAELFNWKTGVQCFIAPLPQVNFLKLVRFLSFHSY